MLTVHHLNLSRSTRVLWALEELQLPYEITRYQRDASFLAPPELKRVHPLGKSPVITDDGQTLAESGAILEYLIERYGNGKLAPARGSKELLPYRYWMHYAEGSLMPVLVMALIFARIPKAPMPFFVRPVAKQLMGAVRQKLITPQLITHFAFVEEALGKSTWFAGEDFTAADIQMSFPLEVGIDRARLTRESHPRIFGFLDRIHARPAYQRAVERSGEKVSPDSESAGHG